LNRVSKQKNLTFRERPLILYGLFRKAMQIREALNSGIKNSGSEIRDETGLPTFGNAVLSEKGFERLATLLRSLLLISAMNILYYRFLNRLEMGHPGSN
jgi:hypothetical protein